MSTMVKQIQGKQMEQESEIKQTSGEDLEFPPQVLLADVQTGVILLDKKGRVPMPTASMSKLMTVYMVFEALKKGSLTPETFFQVSDKARVQGGYENGSSTMFLAAHQYVRVIDLLRGAIIQSGNDACITLAENMAGTEEAFVSQMNQRAKELGLTQTTLKNATGWPAEGHQMSPEDLVILACRLMKDFPEYYPLFSEKTFTFNGITQNNRNPLLWGFPGADGLKTGHTQEAGFGLVGTARQEGHRLVMVINGLQSKEERATKACQIMTWGFKHLKDKKISKGKKLSL